MKKFRIKLVFVTLISYYVFTAIFPIIELESPHRSNDYDDERVRINVVTENVSKVIKIEYNCGMDPTPIPTFPPNVDIDTETLD